MKLGKFVILFFIISSCQLIPSQEYLKSDTLDSKMKLEKINGIYHPSVETISNLSNYYTSKLIDSLTTSTIEINFEKDSVFSMNLPVKIDYKYELISIKGKLNISGLEHEKFRFIDNPKNGQRDIKFRIKDGKKSLLINLNTGDPDEGNEYFEYIINI